MAIIGELGLFTLWIFTMFLGFSGACLVAYGIAASASGESWGPVERHAAFISSLLTVLGTLFTAASVYFYAATPRPPWKGTLLILAPLVILGCVAALYRLCTTGRLPEVIVSGLALMAIAGGLLRLQPHPSQFGW